MSFLRKKVKRFPFLLTFFLQRKESEERKGPLDFKGNKFNHGIHGASFQEKLLLPTTLFLSFVSSYSSSIFTSLLLRSLCHFFQTNISWRESLQRRSHENSILQLKREKTCEETWKGRQEKHLQMKSQGMSFSLWFNEGNLCRRHLLLKNESKRMKGVLFAVNVAVTFMPPSHAMPLKEIRYTGHAGMSMSSHLGIVVQNMITWIEENKSLSPLLMTLRVNEMLFKRDLYEYRKWAQRAGHSRLIEKISTLIYASRLYHTQTTVLHNVKSMLCPVRVAVMKSESFMNNTSLWFMNRVYTE